VTGLGTPNYAVWREYLLGPDVRRGGWAVKLTQAQVRATAITSQQSNNPRCRKLWSLIRGTIKNSPPIASQHYILVSESPLQRV
jgi:hypothetical protein